MLSFFGFDFDVINIYPILTKIAHILPRIKVLNLYGFKTHIIEVLGLIYQYSVNVTK